MLIPAPDFLQQVIDVLEERGRIVLQSDTYITTNAGAEAFGGKTIEPTSATAMNKRKSAKALPGKRKR